MRLIVGLGNHGPRYAANRHNLGFMVLDRLAPPSDFRDKFKGRWAKTRLGGDDVLLLKPHTYMNLSGESVQPAMRFFKIELSELIVVHDELDLPWRDVRVKLGGGAAGHKGLKSIIQHCGGPDFGRIRIGIGRPPRGSVESWVLSDLDKSESAELPDVLDEATRALRSVIEDGFRSAMNGHNQRASKKKAKQKKNVRPPEPEETSTER